MAITYVLDDCLLFLSLSLTVNDFASCGFVFVWSSYLGLYLLYTVVCTIMKIRVALIMFMTFSDVSRKYDLGK